MKDEEKYSYMRALNEMLLKKYNEDQKLLFYDYYLFHMSSMYLSFYREHIEFDNQYSTCELFVLRSLVESITIMKMFDEGNISPDCTELLRGHQYLCEYEVYKEFPKMPKNIIDLDEMKKNYSDVKDYYKETLQLNSKEFSNLLSKNNLPFLKDKYNFHSLIDMYYPEALDLYEKLSVSIHPNIYFDFFKINNYLINYKMILDETLNISIKYYPDLAVSYKHSYEFEKKEYWNVILCNSIKFYIDSFRETYEKIKKDLKIDINGNENREYLILYQLIEPDIVSIYIDYLYGFSEVIKAKIKPLFEKMSVIFYILDNYRSPFFDKLIYSMIKYTDYNFGKREGIDFKEVYDYCKDILKCDSIEELKEKFSKYLPEFLEIGSIKKFVYSMIDKIYPNDDQHQASSLKLLYMESQLLSHGNGYMLSSNYGSFMDRFSAINAIDILIDKFYEKVGDVIEEKAKEDSSFKKANYDFSKLYSNYKNKKDIKNKILHSLIEKKIG